MVSLPSRRPVQVSAGLHSSLSKGLRAKQLLIPLDPKVRAADTSEGLLHLGLPSGPSEGPQCPSHRARTLPPLPQPVHNPACVLTTCNPRVAAQTRPRGSSDVTALRTDKFIKSLEKSDHHHHHEQQQHFCAKHQGDSRRDLLTPALAMLCAHGLFPGLPGPRSPQA